MLHQIHFLSAFSCLGDACPDTCCKGWGMQLTGQTVELYRTRAPELLEAVTSGEADYIMKRDCQSDQCVKLEQGLCSIHRDYGTEFLGDACHFYPRSTRSLGQHQLMTAAPSCPEIVRIACIEPSTVTGDSLLKDITPQRLPYALHDYLPEGMEEDDAFTIHQHILKVAHQEPIISAHLLRRLRSVAASLPLLPPDQWKAALPFYLSQSDNRLPEAQTHISDPFNLLNMLCTLLALSPPSPRLALQQTIAGMEKALAAHFDATQCTLIPSDDSLAALERLRQLPAEVTEGQIEPVMRRWLTLQLSLNLFPFAGIGASLTENVTITAVKYALIRLGLQSLYVTMPGQVAQADQIRVIYSLSRIMDHLTDATTLMSICERTGWDKEARLGGLLL